MYEFVIILYFSLVCKKNAITIQKISNFQTRIKLIRWCLSGEIYSVETLLCLILRSKFPRWIPTLQTDFPLTEIEHFHKIATLGVIPGSQMKSSPVTGILFQIKFN